MSPLEILHRAKPVDDAQFDRIYPEWVRELSEMFWTPVEVAQRAAQLLVDRPGSRILDVGSGVGKFCLVGSCTTEGVFHGIEQRADLVALSSEIGEREGCARTRFQHGDMEDVNWDSYDGIYLFNPFFEQTAGPWIQIDDTIQYSRERQEHYAEVVVGKLSALRVGTRVATYFGFGSTVPDSFEKIAYEQYERGPLEVWVKEA